MDPNCCSDGGEHLHGRDLMYPIAIILLSPYGNNSQCVCMKLNWCTVCTCANACLHVRAVKKPVTFDWVLHVSLFTHSSKKARFTNLSNFYSVFSIFLISERWRGVITASSLSRWMKRGHTLCQPMVIEFRRPRLRELTQGGTKATDEVNEFPLPL